MLVWLDVPAPRVVMHVWCRIAFCMRLTLEKVEKFAVFFFDLHAVVQVCGRCGQACSPG